MSRRVAILRGINVGGKRKILMKDLSKMMESLNFTAISTYIQSGNIIFESAEQGNEAISKTIEKAILDTFGFEVPVVVRTKEEIAAAVANNPFFKEHQAAEKLHLTFLADEPEAEKSKGIVNLNFEPDKCAIIGKNAFIYCEGKYHQSKLSNNFFEKKLAVKATTRNWKTVLKLLELSS